MLKPEYTSQFERDVKRLRKRHVDMTPLKEVVKLITDDSYESYEILRQRHKAHQLKGA